MRNTRRGRRSRQSQEALDSLHYRSVSAKSRPTAITFKGDHLKRQKLLDTKSVIYGGCVGIRADVHLKRHGRLNRG